MIILRNFLFKKCELIIEKGLIKKPFRIPNISDINLFINI